MIMLQRILSYVIAAGLGLLTVTGFGDVERVYAQQQQRAGAPKANHTGIDTVLEPVTRWFERANREYQDDVVKKLSVPTGKGAPLPEQAPGNFESASKPAQVAPREPTLLQQLQDFLGFEVAKGPGDKTPSASEEKKAADKAGTDEMIRKQIEARKLEQERAAEEKRIAEDARKAKESADVATQQRQKAAEAARVAEEERRKGAKPAEEPAKPAIAAVDEEQKALAAKKAEDEARRTNERKVAEAKAATEQRLKLAAAEEKKRQTEKETADAKSARDKSAREKTASEQLAKQAAAEDKQRQAEALKSPEA